MKNNLQETVSSSRYCFNSLIWLTLLVFQSLHFTKGLDSINKVIYNFVKIVIRVTLLSLEVINNTKKLLPVREETRIKLEEINQMEERISVQEEEAELAFETELEVNPNVHQKSFVLSDRRE